MVKKVMAYEAEDGSLWASEEEALRINARRALRELDVFAAPTIDAIIANVLEIYCVLTPLRNHYDSMMFKTSAADVMPAQSETIDEGSN
jgi:hypothetical protein